MLPEKASRSPGHSLEDIVTDRAHGAAWLSLRALELLGARAAQLAGNGVGAAEAWHELTAVAAVLLEARPAMAVVRNRVNRLMSRARGLPAAEVAELAGRLHAEALEADRCAAALAAGHVAGKRVLTLSRSATVRAALLAAQPGPVSVLVAESRPGGEGRGVAEELAASGFGVTLLPDAALAAALAAPGADVVVVGADAVLPDGSVVNKTGTRLLAVAAREQGIPCYAIAAADKIGDAVPGDEQGEGGELYDGAAKVAVWAPLFEVTPGGLFAAILTERGALTPPGVASVAVELGALAGWSAG
jgi:translation initiation factor 2B subunit (eIF-2B alpha/beta/delta family)